MNTGIKETPWDQLVLQCSPASGADLIRHVGHMCDHMFKLYTPLISTQPVGFLLGFLLIAHRENFREA